MTNKLSPEIIAQLAAAGYDITERKPAAPAPSVNAPYTSDMTQRLADAERRIKTSGQSHASTDLVRQLREDAMKKYGMVG